MGGSVKVRTSLGQRPPTRYHYHTYDDPSISCIQTRMVVLGLDPGIDRLGYGVLRVDGRRTQWVAHGVLSTLRSDDLAMRLRDLYNALRELLATHVPDRVCVERLYFSTNVKTAMTVGHARGVVLLTCALAQCAVVEVSPQDVKQAVTGYGAAEKRQVQRMVQTLLHLSELPTPDDAADALAIAWTGATVSRIARV